MGSEFLSGSAGIVNEAISSGKRKVSKNFAQNESISTQNQIHVKPCEAPTVASEAPVLNVFLVTGGTMVLQQLIDGKPLFL